MLPNRDMYIKYFADLRRVCELEDAVVEWYSNAGWKGSEFDPSPYFDLQMLKVESLMYGGIDFEVCRIQFSAT